MFCHYCGAKLIDGARFCSKCGTRVPEEIFREMEAEEEPQAAFPIYPFISPKRELMGDDPETDTAEDLKEDFRLYGCTAWEAVKQAYEIPEHAEGFPPAAIFLTAGDELVSPEHSKMLAAALEKLSIPCRLEIGPEGGHGFADGTDMCMAGWTERAVRWFESLNPVQMSGKR